MTSITFSLDYMGKENDRTFSAEGLISFMGVLEDYLNKLLVQIMKDGFNKNEPVQKFEVDMTFKVNGRTFSKEQTDEIMKQYPDMVGLSKEALIEIMQDKKE